jgi:hypothetical protein
MPRVVEMSTNQKRAITIMLDDDLVKMITQTKQHASQQNMEFSITEICQKAIISALSKTIASNETNILKDKTVSTAEQLYWSNGQIV